MILVTGGTGLIGSHVLFKLIEDGQQVKAVKRETSLVSKTRRVFEAYHPRPSELLDQIEWLEVDLLDYNSVCQAMEGVEEVYHCAGKVDFIPADKKKLIREHRAMTANLVNACIGQKVKKFCHVSSIATLGNRQNGEEIAEEDHLDPGEKHPAYSHSKYQAELEVWRGMEEGLQAVIVHPSVVLGPGDWTCSSLKIIKQVHEGLTYYPPGTTGIVDARDLASFMIMLMNEGLFGESFIANAENISLEDMFRKISRYLNKQGQKMKPLSYSLAKKGVFLERVLARLLFRAPRINMDLINSGFSQTTYSNKKAKEKTGFTFRPVDETIAFACQQFLEDN